MSLTILGAAGAKPVTVSQTGYTGAFTENDNCAGTATVTSTSNGGGTATYTITALASGACTAGFTGGGARVGQLAITTAISGSVSVVPAPLNFIATGAGAAATVTVTQASYTGTFTESDTCSGIETIAVQTNASGSATYLVTPLASGICHIVFAGGSAQSFTLNTSVTVVSLGVFSVDRKL